MTSSRPLITSRLMLATTAEGDDSTSPYARNALRSWPIVAAARQPVAHHVPHHQRHAPVGALERVVPVAADGRARTAGR